MKYKEIGWVVIFDAGYSWEPIAGAFGVTRAACVKAYNDRACIPINDKLKGKPTRKIVRVYIQDGRYGDNQ